MRKKAKQNNVLQKLRKNVKVKAMEKEQKFEKKPIIDIEVSPEDLEKYKEFKEGVEVFIQNIEDFELTEEDIKEGFETYDHDKYSPVVLCPETFGHDFEDPEEEKKVIKVILNFAFEEFGVDKHNLELIQEKGDEKFFKTNRPDIVLAYNGDYWWFERIKEK